MVSDSNRRPEYDDGYEAGVEDAIADIDQYLLDLEDALRDRLVRPSFELDLIDLFDRLGYRLRNKDIGF
jgi:hypothetical protein